MLFYIFPVLKSYLDTFHIWCFPIICFSTCFPCWKVISHISHLIILSNNRQKTEEDSVSKSQWIHPRLTITTFDGVLENIFSSEQMDRWTMIQFTSGILGCPKSWNLLLSLSLWSFNHHQTSHWNLSLKLTLQVISGSLCGQQQQPSVQQMQSSSDARTSSILRYVVTIVAF